MKMTGKEIFYKEAMKIGIDTDDIKALYSAMMGCFFPETYEQQYLSLIEDEFIKVVFLYNKFRVGIERIFYQGENKPSTYKVIKL